MLRILNSIESNYLRLFIKTGLTHSGSERKTERYRDRETERQKKNIFTVGAFALVGVAVAVRVHDGHAVAGGGTSA
jgi:hypothetical protein